MINGISIDLFGENTDTVRNNATHLVGANTKIRLESNSETA